MSPEGLPEGIEELEPVPLERLVCTGDLGGGPSKGGSCFHFGLVVGGGPEVGLGDGVDFGGGPMFQ